MVCESAATIRDTARVSHGLRIGYKAQAFIIRSYCTGMQQLKLPALGLRVQDGLEVEEAARSMSGPPFLRLLAGLVRRPQRILLLWNWKAAWLSVLLRGPIFLAATIRRGFGATFAAVFTECVFCMFTAGFYGAFVQSLRDAEPEWITILFLTMALPGSFQVLEFLIHWLRGTPHLLIAESFSILVGGLAVLFNWYAMRRGALLVGGEGGSFGSDLQRLPGLLLKFTMALPNLWKERGKVSSKNIAPVPSRRT